MFLKSMPDNAWKEFGSDIVKAKKNVNLACYKHITIKVVFFILSIINIFIGVYLDTAFMCIPGVIYLSIMVEYIRKELFRCIKTYLW